MSLVLKTDWQPSARISDLKIRAQLLAQIREFFAKRGVWEVETPLLCQTAATDPFLHAITVGDRYLQTSPEFAMKRLLAAGSGSIYQLCKAFRSDEQGRLHNPEFSMLEWYRVGFTHHELMDEMEALLTTVLATPQAERLTYQEVFERYLGFNPHTQSCSELECFARERNIDLELDTVDDWLDVLMTHCIEPHLGFEAPAMIYDYPASKAALAKIRGHVAERFEVYIQGIELANGYHELTDPVTQQERFIQDNEHRRQHGTKEMPIDTRLLAALEHGLPASAGVALGVDRLVMIKLKRTSLDEVISFGHELA